MEVDLSGIEWIDESKMKILFHEAKNEDGADFDTHTPDTYKDVYAVEPVSRHSSYIISRNITVKEPETEQQSENSSEIVVDDNGDTGDSKDVRQICEEILICIFCSFYFYDMKLHEIKMSLISVKKLIKMRYVFTRINISVHIRLIFH